MAKKRAAKTRTGTKRRTTKTAAHLSPFLFKKPHEAVKWMNTRYGVCPEGNRTIVISEIDDPLLHRK